MDRSRCLTPEHTTRPKGSCDQHLDNVAVRCLTSYKGMARPISTVDCRDTVIARDADRVKQALSGEEPPPA